MYPPKSKLCAVGKRHVGCALYFLSIGPNGATDFGRTQTYGRPTLYVTQLRSSLEENLCGVYNIHISQDSSKGTSKDSQLLDLHQSNTAYCT